MRKKFSVSISVLLVLSLGLGLLLPAARGDNLYLSLDGLLPSKSDDPAVYPVLQETEWYYGTSWSETLIVPGFVEGRAVEYYRRYTGPGDIRSVEFYAFLFTEVGSAEEYYNAEVAGLKSVTEFAEVILVGAFGGIFEFGGMETGVGWGIVSNVVFKIVVYAYLREDPTDRLVSFTSLERTRILDKVGNTSIPEFPGLSVLPFFGLVALLGLRFGRKIPRLGKSAD